MDIQSEWIVISGMVNLSHGNKGLLYQKVCMKRCN